MKSSERGSLGIGGGAGIKDAPSKKDKKAKAGDEEEEEGETFYDAMKKEMGGRLARTRAALDALDDEQRLAMEGHRPGAYLRLSFSGAYALLCSLCCMPPAW